MSIKDSVCITFDDNSLLPALYGEHEKNLQEIERNLNVIAASRGNIVSISGETKKIDIAKNILESLYDKIQKGNDIGIKDVQAAIRIISDEKNNTKESPKSEKLFEEEVVIKTPKKYIKPYSSSQKKYIKSLYEYDMCFGIGPAGTGKTYLAVAAAVSMFSNHKIERIILSRPAVEAGEKLGFLPGDMKEKVDPYLRPLYDALYDMLPEEKVNKLLEIGIIEVAPIAFMRGRTLNNAFVILDEAQNVTPVQMKMFLTRMGEGTKMVVTGDPSQIDLERGQQSGLLDALHRLKNIKEISTISFNEKDVVRHPLTSKIISAYESSI